MLIELEVVGARTTYRTKGERSVGKKYGLCFCPKAGFYVTLFGGVELGVEIKGEKTSFVLTLLLRSMRMYEPTNERMNDETVKCTCYYYYYNHHQLPEQTIPSACPYILFTIKKLSMHGLLRVHVNVVSIYCRKTHYNVWLFLVGYTVHLIARYKIRCLHLTSYYSYFIGSYFNNEVTVHERLLLLVLFYVRKHSLLL